jgi:succinate--hydroxymethylglutarate CoA-transferase
MPVFPVRKTFSILDSSADCLPGYGPSGPFAKRAGYDMIAGAEAGLLHITGEANGPPTKPGVGMTDMCTGLYMHGAIVSALHARRRTGRGQKIDGSLFETQISLLINVASAWLNLGIEGQRWGTEHPSIVPYGAFKTKDSFLVITATNQKQWTMFCNRLGASELIQDERFKTNELRVQHREVLKPILDGIFLAKSTDEWLSIFDGSGMPYGPINDMQRVFDHPQAKARKMMETVDFDATETGKLALLGMTFTFESCSLC